MNVMVRLHNSEALKETLTYGIRILFGHRRHPRAYTSFGPQRIHGKLPKLRTEMNKLLNLIKLLL